MKIFDITRILSEDTPVYPGDPGPVFSQVEHSWYRISSLRIGTHNGTHIDAPSHCTGYSGTIDRVPLDNLIGGCRVIDARSAGPLIGASFLKEMMATARRILLKTDCSLSNRYHNEHPALSSDAARLLVDRGTLCFGTDAPSVEPSGDEGTVHRLLLGGGCSIIEFLDLSQVPPGDYFLVALPLRLAGLDGSPARVVLLKDNEDVNDGHHY